MHGIKQRLSSILIPGPLSARRRGAGEVKLHPWFAGVDWPSLARQKVAFVPQPDCDTDTSYFSSKPVSQRSLALDLDSSRSELLEAAAAAAGALGGGLHSPAGSLPSSRSHSRLGSKRASTRRRSLRQALAEPSGASWSELRGMPADTLSHSSGGSNTSRASLSGTADMAVDASAGSVVRAAADRLARQQLAGGSSADELGCSVGSPSSQGCRRAVPPQVPAAPGQRPSRGSTILSSADLPAGEQLRGLLPAEDDEALPPRGTGSEMAALSDGTSALPDAYASSQLPSMDLEEDSASVSGSSGGTPLGSEEYGSSASGGRRRPGSSSGGGSSGEQTSPHFRGFSFKNLGMLAEQNLEALRWVCPAVGWPVGGSASQACSREGPGRRWGK